MIKTEVEILLENRLGNIIRDRIYRDDVIIAAEVDDSAAEAHKNDDPFPLFEDSSPSLPDGMNDETRDLDLLKYIFERTSYQQDRDAIELHEDGDLKESGDATYLFTRESYPVNGLWFIYQIRASKGIEKYGKSLAGEALADRILRDHASGEEEIGEFVDFYLRIDSENVPIARIDRDNVTISAEEGGGLDISAEEEGGLDTVFGSDYSRSLFYPDIKQRLDRLKEYNGKKYTPETFANAIIEFMRPDN